MLPEKDKKYLRMNRIEYVRRARLRTVFRPDNTRFESICEQCRPSSDAAKAASDQGLHCSRSEISIQNTVKRKYSPESLITTNELDQMIWMDKSTGQKWVTHKHIYRTSRLVDAQFHSHLEVITKASAVSFFLSIIMELEL